MHFDFICPLQVLYSTLGVNSCITSVFSLSTVLFNWTSCLIVGRWTLKSNQIFADDLPLLKTVDSREPIFIQWVKTLDIFQREIRKWIVKNRLVHCSVYKFIKPVSRIICRTGIESRHFEHFSNHTKFIQICFHQSMQSTSQ